MRKWEYCRFWIDGPVWENLEGTEESNYIYSSINEAGADGWELVQFIQENPGQDGAYWVFKREVVEESSKPESIKEKSLDLIVCDVPIEELNLSTITYNALRHRRIYDHQKDEYIETEDIKTIGDLLSLSGNELCGLHSFGARGLEAVRKSLTESGYSNLCPSTHWANNNKSFGRLQS